MKKSIYWIREAARKLHTGVCVSAGVSVSSHRKLVIFVMKNSIHWIEDAARDVKKGRVPGTAAVVGISICIENCARTVDLCCTMTLTIAATLCVYEYVIIDAKQQ